MRPVEIEGVKFTLASKKEVTNVSAERVENLTSRLFFDKIDLAQILMTNETGDKKKKKGDENKEIFATLMEDKNAFVNLLRVMSTDTTLQSMMGVMLTTGLDYDELHLLPRLVLPELIKESEKEIGTVEDFTKTFNLNMSINPIDLLNNLQSIFGAP
jgi:hypothetical protein